MPKNTGKSSASMTPAGRRDSPLDTLMEAPAFRVRMGTAHSARSSKIKGFIGHMKAMVRQYGGISGRHRANAGVGGSAAARIALRTHPQRVVIKARVVKHSKFAQRKGGAMGALAKHMDYLGRGSAAEDRTRGVVFNAEEDLTREELTALRREMVGDRHHFRFIVSPEAGERLNLKDFARELVKEMEADVGTPLTWIGVAHYDTDDPHLHLLVRGKDATGGDLVINRNYISHGMRLQAMEVATRHLGPRLPEDLERSLQRDLTADRVTGIDLGLDQQASRHPDGWVTALRKADGSLAGERQRLHTLTRLQHLESLGLAREIAPGVWQPDAQLLERLRRLSTRGDIIKRMHERMRGLDRGAAPVTTDVPPRAPVVGRVVARGVVDELSEAQVLVVEARDGQAYTVAVGDSLDADGMPIGAIVRLSAAQAGKAADAQIAHIAAAHGGLFDADRHVRDREIGATSDGADSAFESLLQRARALSHRGLVENLGGDRFRVPADLKSRISNERGRPQGIHIERLSVTDLDTQTREHGVTWLDREIAGGADVSGVHRSGASRFEREWVTALQERARHLQGLGLAEEVGGEFRVRGRFLDELYERELQDAGRRLQSRFGERVALDEDATIKGTVAAIEALPSGPHAVIAMSGRYALVPADASLSRQVGRNLTLTVGHRQRLPALGEGLPKLAIRFVALDRTRKRGR